MAERTVPVQTSRAAQAHEPTRAEDTYVRPPVDIYEDQEGLVVIADIPGVDPNALNVQVDRGILTIQGQATHLATAPPVEREYVLTGFFRQFQLPEEIDSANITADLKNGVLTLRLPRLNRGKPLRITVRSA